jgi:hypothetical protein
MAQHATYGRSHSEEAVARYGGTLTDEQAYFRGSPKILKVNDGENEVFALTLSLDLVKKIQRALCLGRWYIDLSAESKNDKFSLHATDVDLTA